MYEAARQFEEPETESRELLWTDDRHPLVSLLKWD
jgi:hypothetical protein